MNRLSRPILGVAVCCVMFAIGCVIYSYVDQKRVRDSLGDPARTAAALQTDAGGAAPADAPPTAAGSPSTEGATAPDDVGTEADASEKARPMDPLAELWNPFEAEDFGTEGDTAADTEPYPPKNWRNETTDIYLYAEYLRAELIKQFGEVPQVDIFVEGLLKIHERSGRTFGEEFVIDSSEPLLTLDEQIEHAQAASDLFGNETNRETLASLREQKANGGRVPDSPRPPPSAAFESLQHDFADMAPFVEQYGLKEGVSAFAAQTPQHRARALEFKRALWDTPEVQNELEEMPEEGWQFFSDILASE